MASHLRMVDPDRHLVFQNELKQGSAELIDIFESREIGANQTSVGVGYAPSTEMEQLVLASDAALAGVNRSVETLMEEIIGGIADFTERLVQGEFAVD